MSGKKKPHDAARRAGERIAANLFTPGWGKSKQKPAQYLRLADEVPGQRGTYVERGCGWSSQPVIDMMLPIIRRAIRVTRTPPATKRKRSPP